MAAPIGHYTTSEFVYDKIGVTSEIIPQPQMNRLLELADAEVDRIISSTCVPKTRIETRDGNNSTIMYIRNSPLMKVIRIRIDGVDLDMADVVFREFGEIRLLNTADKIFFFRNTAFPRAFNNVRIQYLYGWLEETSTQSDSVGDATAGTASTITVGAGDGALFEAGKFVRIVGFDGNEERGKVISVSTDTLTIDLVYDHEDGSTVTLLEVPPMVKQLAGIIATIMGALFQIGSTYTFATSYQTPDYSVVKGVPYPHFQKVLDAAVAERDFIMTQLPRWPAFS